MIIANSNHGAKQRDDSHTAAWKIQIQCEPPPPPADFIVIFHIHYFHFPCFLLFSIGIFCSLNHIFDNFMFPLFARLHVIFVCSILSCIWLFAIPWTVACQAPLSMEFSRREYWSRLPFPFPRDLPNPGIKLLSIVSPFCRGILYLLSHQRAPHIIIWCSLVLLQFLTENLSKTDSVSLPLSLSSSEICFFLIC